MTKLSDKQEKFCNEYLVDLNATQAAIRSGYSEKTAQQIGSENLSKPVIQERIAELRDGLSKDDLTPERVLAEYKKLAFFDIRKIYNEDGSLKKITELDDDTAAALVSVRSSADLQTEYKMADKKASLDSISKILGLFVEKHEHTGKNGKDLIPDMDDTERARRVLFAIMMAENDKNND